MSEHPAFTRGFDASARVGNDVDGGPNARSLSGALGEATASGTVTGPRGEVFRTFANALSWSPGLPSWMWMGDANFTIGVPEYGFSRDHRDQLTGRDGAIRAIFTELDPPRYAVRQWDWMRQPPRGGMRDATPFLAAPTYVSLSTTEFEAGTLNKTRVDISHRGLPLEWVEDLSIWWEFQIAVFEAEGFGTRQN